ncbi:MAG: 3'(2'),5'-bisphosphate nucleotidase CysQ [Acidobacteria bacterium]|nr:3'(2'),5'-bisphosphate nucleotidase CysQ [Acidobacteriota bacterium]
MTVSSYSGALDRIQSALEGARKVFSRFQPGEIAAEYKAGHDPVTEVDRELDRWLRKQLLRNGEGWLSEESADDLSRLYSKHVWIVDPLDGTREFVAGIPEFCVSIAFIEEGEAVAGGILNPASGELFLGALDSGMTHNGVPARPRERPTLEGATVLASRSENTRGEWERFRHAPFRVVAVGSVAYKLARVAAGLADATFTLSPKHEWDVAAGVALVKSSGGFVRALERSDLAFNQPSPRITGLIACRSQLRQELLALLEVSDLPGR